MYGDPEGVRRLARRVAEAADQTRADAQRAAAGAEVAWVSTRAKLYREHLQESVRLVRRCSGELDDLERALLEHAAAVEHRLEQIAAAERWLRQQADDAQDAARDAARSARNAVERAIGDVLGNVKDELQDAASDLAGKAQRLTGAVRGLNPGSLDWIDAARAQGWRG